MDNQLDCSKYKVLAAAHLQLLFEDQLELFLLTHLLLQRCPFTRVAINQAFMRAKQRERLFSSALQHRVYFSLFTFCLRLPTEIKLSLASSALGCGQADTQQADNISHTHTMALTHVHT